MVDSNTPMVMPVSPAYGGGGFGMGFGSDIWLILILLFAFNGGWGMGGFGGWGGMGGFAADGAMLYPWMNQAQVTTNGFQNQALGTAISGIQNSITSGFGDVQLGIAGVNQNICQTGAGIQNSLCNGFNSVNQNINSAQNAISAQMYNNEIANLNRSFAEQTANVQGFNNLQASTNDVRYALATEACATRTANATNTRDILDATNRTGQAILDKLCQLELDNVKTQLDAKNDRIVDLQNQLNMAAMRESQTAQNAFISQGFSNEVDQLYNRLSNCPVPSTPVYGRTPIFTCGGNGYGCGCGAVA